MRFRLKFEYPITAKQNWKSSFNTYDYNSIQITYFLPPTKTLRRINAWKQALAAFLASVWSCSNINCFSNHFGHINQQKMLKAIGNLQSKFKTTISNAAQQFCCSETCLIYLDLSSVLQYFKIECLKQQIIFHWYRPADFCLIEFAAQ